MVDDTLKLSDQTTLVPVLNGSADWAVALRKIYFDHSFDALAIPLPPSFQRAVEEGIQKLPKLSVVVQSPNQSSSFESSFGSQENFEESQATYVPIDPCQGVIQMVRLGMQERVPRIFIDMETHQLQNWQPIAPDPYALKKVSLIQYAASLIPDIPEPNPQGAERIVCMVEKLKQLEKKYHKILMLAPLDFWPWIRKEYHAPSSSFYHEDIESEVKRYSIDAKTSIFMLGELPFITWLYEQARRDLTNDDNLSIDGIKELVLESRDRYLKHFGKRSRPLTPQLLKIYLKYVRNLSLIRNKLTPDLYTLVTASQQIMGDQFAIFLAQTARDYLGGVDSSVDSCTVGKDRLRLPEGDVYRATNRLAGTQMDWKNVKLNPLPDKKFRDLWQMRWNPHMQCSWPAEDEKIENFRHSVMNRAQEIMGQDLARSEKFAASVKDGLDIRETLRNWHTGDLYVKEFPPSRGGLDAALMLFESNPDPRDYPWRTTWMAEHDEESTLCFFATDYSKEVVGPGIGLATYGGALFLYPPRTILDIWSDPRFDTALTLEDRLVMAGCFYSENKHMAFLSDSPPSASHKEIAKKFNKKFVHVPLSKFSTSTVAQLRLVHVLNGKNVRSYASHFIRKA